MTGAALVRLVGVSRSYGSDAHRVEAVHDVTVSVAPGEIVALVGASGAGKSTIGRLMLGLERPDAGRVIFDGVDLGDVRLRRLRRIRRQFHLILQDPFTSLHPSLRVSSIVAEPLNVQRVNRPDRDAAVQAGLHRVGLTPVADFAARFPHELSGGQRQRVALARAFVARPRLVVADEPTSMLDASLRAGILDLLRVLQSEVGTAIVFITHDLASARCLCDRVVVVSDGRIVADESADDLVDNPPNPLVAELVAASEHSLSIRPHHRVNLEVTNQ